jgi:hypothetical protein
MVLPHVEGHAIEGFAIPQRMDAIQGGRGSSFRFRNNARQEVIAQLRWSGDLRAVGQRRQNQARIRLF